jgi:hypothetical protein
MERFFKDPHTLQHKRQGPLGPYIDEFARQLSEQSYSRQYACRQLQLVRTSSDLISRLACLAWRTGPSRRFQKACRSNTSTERWPVAIGRVPSVVATTRSCCCSHASGCEQGKWCASR